MLRILYLFPGWITATPKDPQRQGSVISMTVKEHCPEPSVNSMALPQLAVSPRRASSRALPSWKPLSRQVLKQGPTIQVISYGPLLRAPSFFDKI